MKHDIDFGGAGPQELTITTSGTASVDGFVDLIEQVVADDRFRPGMAVLADHSALDLAALRGGDMQAVAQKLVDLDERVGPSRLAIVAASPASFGLVRVFQAYADAAQIDVGVFYSRAEAEEWLRER